MAGIYIHIPYCKKKCIYCNFYFQISQKNKKELIKSIIKEIELRKNYLKNLSINTVYFGGGTPSVLDKEEIKKILNQIYKVFNINNDAEITMECNPDDLNLSKLKFLKTIGFNRLSIGVQSFNDSDLKLINRTHNSSQAINCILQAKKIGFKNISIDLIYGLPNQSLKKWELNMVEFFKLDVSHFSAYQLTVEKNTFLNKLLNKGKIQLPKENTVLSQYKLLLKMSKKFGYINYEISNFGKVNYFSEHNISYWRNNYYIGIGPSAHSYNGVERRWNVSSNSKYINNINDEKIFYKKEILSENQKYNEYVFTSLRTIYGVDSEYIERKFGKKIKDHFIREIKKWEALKLTKINTKYFLNNEGKLHADTISSDLFIT